MTGRKGHSRQHLRWLRRHRSNSDRRWFPKRPKPPVLTRREFVISCAIAAVLGTVAPVRDASAFRVGGTGAIPNRVFYVDATAGSDSNNGLSPGTAWQTITHVNAQSYIANDTVLFNAATAFSGAINLGTSNWSGSMAAPLTLGSYGSGSASINSGASVGLTLTNIAGVIVDNLTLAGTSQAANETFGVYVGNTGTGQLSGIQFVNLSISNYGGTGIEFEATTTGGFVNIVVQNCTVNDCGNNATGVPDGPCGIHLYTAGAAITDHTAYSTNILIHGCTLTNLPGGSSGEGGGFGVFMFNCSNSTVEYTYVNNTAQNWTVADSGPVGIIFVSCTSCIMQFCEASNVQPNNNVDGEGFDIDIGCSNCITQYCYSHDNYGAGYYLFCDSDGPGSNNTIRYCVSQNNGTHTNMYGVQAEIAVWNNSGSTATANIYNNTLWTNSSIGSSGILFTGGSTLVGNVCNNIIYSGSNGAALINNMNGGSVFTFNGNCYFAAGAFLIKWNGTNFSSYSSWTGTTGQEPLGGGFTSNPLLNNPGGGGTISPPYDSALLTAYMLASGSPMKGVGLNLLSQFSINPGSQDFYGNAIPNGSGGTGFNVGAYGGT